MTPETIARLRVQLARHEGTRNRMYLDGRGVPTIGIGHNLRDVPISDRAVAVIFDDDASDALADLETRLPWALGLSEPRQAVLVNMIFNLGVAGLLGFHRMLHACAAGKYDTAAAEMRASEWAGQVGDRAIELAEQMATGEWGS